VVVVTSSVDVLEGWNSSFLDWRHEADTENWFICLILEMGKMPLDIGVSPEKCGLGTGSRGWMMRNRMRGAYTISPDDDTVS